MARRGRADIVRACRGWNAIYTASCFDPYVETFARARYRKAPEDLCVDGVDRGGVFIEPAAAAAL